MKNLFSYTVLGLLAASLLASCFLKSYKPENMPLKRLEFGQGGGVTGAVKEYTLLPNGQVFVKNTLDNYYLELKRVKPREFKSAWHKLDSLRFLKYDFYHPGNVYAFLRLSDEEVEQEIAWDPYGYWQPEEGFLKVYNQLMQTVQNLPVQDTLFLMPDSTTTATQ
ncbi:MAG TPA: hypothetical protein ENJ88_05675 [Phaeodactylibacter sp.]|nr:hypothetical protein [Phaeodactylibacter sp.]